MTQCPNQDSTDWSSPCTCGLNPAGAHKIHTVLTESTKAKLLKALRK